MKISTSFYRHTLLPNIYKAKVAGINIRDKAALLSYFHDGDENFWVCCASGTDIDSTADIVEAMVNEKHDVLATLVFDDEEGQTKKLLRVVAGLRRIGKNELAEKLYIRLEAKMDSDLNKKLWNSNLQVLGPEKASDEYIKKLAKEAKDYLHKYTTADDHQIEEAVLEFIDQLYFSDIGYKGMLTPQKVFADLYYKNRDDELDDLEINSDISDAEVQLANREITKHL